MLLPQIKIGLKGKDQTSTEIDQKVSGDTAQGHHCLCAHLSTCHWPLGSPDKELLEAHQQQQINFSAQMSYLHLMKKFIRYIVKNQSSFKETSKFLILRRGVKHLSFLKSYRVVFDVQISSLLLQYLTLACAK